MKSNSSLRLFLMIAGFAAGGVAYQNCAQSDFVASGSQGLASASSMATFNPSSIAKITCTSYVDLGLPQTGTLNIPARDSSGTCYVVKLISSVSFSPSTSNPKKDSSMLSNNHDTHSGNQAPYDLGTAQFTLQMAGDRSIVLAGAKDQNTQIQVDNYIVVGVTPSGAAYNANFYHAYGSADAPMVDANENSLGYIQLNSKDVALTTFAQGGTSSIAPLAIDASIVAGQPFNIDIRARDCGGIGVASDIYMIFQ